MRYTITIPCRPRWVDGVDENLQWYKWCVTNGYTFVKYNKFVRTDGNPGWSWEFAKVLTDEQERSAAEPAKKASDLLPPQPDLTASDQLKVPNEEDNFLPVLLGLSIITFIVVYKAVQLWNR